MPTYQVGDLIGPHYQVEAILGEGGMAVVYRCHHTVLGHVRAIKVLNEELSRVEDARTRFMQEAGTQARLDHPNIMGVAEFIEQGLLVAYAMPIAAGFEGAVSLADRLDHGPLDLATAVAWFDQLAGALERAHAAGVIHRDVKPSNVLLDTDPAGNAVLRLMDFGVAKVLQGPARTRTGTTLGTPEYMAPEQIQDPRRVGPASDQYAAGCVLYEMLSGHRPFERGAGETDYSFMHRVVTQPIDPRPLETVPRGAQAVLQRALAKDPTVRFALMGEMAAVLRGAVSERHAQEAARAAGEARVRERARVREEAQALARAEEERAQALARQVEGAMTASSRTSTPPPADAPAKAEQLEETRRVGAPNRLLVLRIFVSISCAALLFVAALFMASGCKDYPRFLLVSGSLVLCNNLKIGTAFFSIFSACGSLGIAYGTRWGASVSLLCSLAFLCFSLGSAPGTHVVLFLLMLLLCLCSFALYFPIRTRTGQRRTSTR